MTLSPADLRFLLFLREYRHEHGYAPTMREIAEGLGRSVVTIFERAERLERAGVLTRKHGEARTLRIAREDLLPPRKRAVLMVVGSIGADGIHGFGG